MKATGFGYYLRDTRENAKISLRRLAQETKLDPAYLSRLERELNPAPRQEVIERIAKALCDLKNLPIAECEKLKRDLLDSAGQLTGDADLIDDLKQRFAERLREKGTLESYIKNAVNKVSLEAMDRVLSGEESLEILSPGDFINDEIKESKSQGEDLSYRSIKRMQTYAMQPDADEMKTTTVVHKKAINSLIKIGKEQGYLTYSEINNLLPEDLLTPEQVEPIVTILEELDIDVVAEAPDADTDKLSGEDLIEFEEDAIEFDQDNSASDYIDSHSKKFKFSFPSSSPSPRRRGRAVKKTKFRAGARAFIEVDGDLTSNQEELLRSITNTVRSILKGK